jgi:hypothetical protein
MSKPIILLDVDGVLNPFPFTPGIHEWEFEPTFTSSAESGSWPLNLSKEMGRALVELGCEIQWLTTWILRGDFANSEIGRPLGWEPHVAMEVVATSNTDPFWKVRTVKKLLETSGPKVIWIDDEGAKFINLFDDIAVLDPHDRLLVVSTASSVGITKFHIEAIRAFINE